MLDLSRLSCLGEALRDASVTFKSNVALIEAERHRENARFTYRELTAQAERVGARLQAAGVEAGDRVAILMSNQSRWVIAGLAAMWSGAVLVPLDYKLSANEELALLAHSRPKVLITEYGIWRSLVGANAVAFEGTLVIVSEAPADAALGGATRFEEGAQTAFRFVSRKRSDVACIVYSSGTGGTPKGCMLPHESYLEQAQALAAMYTMVETDRYFSILPTNHALDFMCGLILPLLHGAAIVHQRTLRPEFLAPTMKRYGITHMALVPRVLKALRERIEEQLAALPEWQRTLVSGLMQVNEVATLRAPKPWLSRTLLKPIHERFGGKLKYIFAGGAFVDADLAAFFYRLGLPVAIGYGLTEGCTVLTLNDGKPMRFDTVGRPVGGVELRLRNQGPDGVGEVCVRSRTLMQGYFEAPELTREVLVDGWLLTGDLGTLDAAGHLKLVGRVKNLIVTQGGKNVYPEDVEAAFDSVPCEELCVFAESYVWPRRDLQGEALLVVVRARKDVSEAESLAAIKASNQKLADFKRVTSYLFVDAEFPRTASMKIKREAFATQLRALSPSAQRLLS